MKIRPFVNNALKALKNTALFSTVYKAAKWVLPRVVIGGGVVQLLYCLLTPALSTAAYVLLVGLLGHVIFKLKDGDNVSQ